MSICSTHSSTSAPEATVSVNGYRFDHDEVERLDAEFLERGGVLGFAKVGQQARHARADAAS